MVSRLSEGDATTDAAAWPGPRVVAPGTPAAVPAVQPLRLRRRALTPRLTSCGRCCSPANALITVSTPVRVGTTHCRAASCRCALATSGGVVIDGSVPDSAGTAWFCETFLPSMRLYAVAPRAAAVTAVLTTAIVPTPFWAFIRSVFPASCPTLPMRCAPIAAALTGVQRSQPAFATAPVVLAVAASEDAGLRATALASVPPNHAERPTS